TRLERLAAEAIPFSRNQSAACSRFPALSARAFLQSITPAPVFSRRSITTFASISIVRTVPTSSSHFQRPPARIRSEGQCAENRYAPRGLARAGRFRRSAPIAAPAADRTAVVLALLPFLGELFALQHRIRDRRGEQLDRPNRVIVAGNAIR